jgi:hypothetical protein
MFINQHIYYNSFKSCCCRLVLCTKLKLSTQKVLTKSNAYAIFRTAFSKHKNIQKVTCYKSHHTKIAIKGSDQYLNNSAWKCIIK